MSRTATPSKFPRLAEIPFWPICSSGLATWNAAAAALAKSSAPTSFNSFTKKQKDHTSNPPRHFFTIVLPNRNYGSQPETTLIEKVDTEPNTEKRTERTATQAKRKTGIQAKLGQQIIQIIKQNNKITLRDISEMLGVSLRTLNRRISEMPTVKYISSGYRGHWEIDDN